MKSWEKDKRTKISAIKRKIIRKELSKENLMLMGYMTQFNKLVELKKIKIGSCIA